MSHGSKSLIEDARFPNELKEDLDYWCKQWLVLTKDIKEQNKVIAKESRANKECTQQEVRPEFQVSGDFYLLT